MVHVLPDFKVTPSEEEPLAAVRSDPYEVTLKPVTPNPMTFTVVTFIPKNCFPLYGRTSADGSFHHSYSPSRN